ncbi:tumor necrosis factor receptor superfamily member 25 isoform X2 [Denticeps clupeoides]|uniref:tumor necrosis factor receptor superfamily member 25 isoform X2 n=1 Tax=Denticeps clupeoides TaxID=299321 RepID=UPI0010A3E686|nr:tumor necrosis factor receptor superfamily member 25-like isoform X2 [Denticeps clupeoides]
MIVNVLLWVMCWVPPMVTFYLELKHPKTVKRLEEFSNNPLTRETAENPIRRSLRSSGMEDVCTEEILTRNPSTCCRDCPAGYKKNGNVDCSCQGESVCCSVCPSGHYTDIRSTYYECQKCTDCDTGVFQIQLKPCTSTQNRVCGCQVGYYNKNTASELTCRSCSECTNCPECSRTTPSLVPITSNCTSGLTCQPCENDNCAKEECKDSPNCQAAVHKSFGLVSVVITVITVMLLLWGSSFFLSLTYRARARYTWNKEKKDNLTDQGQPVICMPLATDMSAAPPETKEQGGFMAVQCRNVQDSIKSKSGSNSHLLLSSDSKTIHKQEAQVLYAIIKEIPVRRWKEFLRLLSVSDEDMERVEMEAGPSYLERQYQMLRLWSITSRAELEVVFSTLDSMGLSGCAQTLQEEVQRILKSVN